MRVFYPQSSLLRRMITKDFHELVGISIQHSPRLNCIFVFAEEQKFGFRGASEALRLCDLLSHPVSVAEQ